MEEPRPEEAPLPQEETPAAEPASFSFDDLPDLDASGDEENAGLTEEVYDAPPPRKKERGQRQRAAFSFFRGRRGAKPAPAYANEDEAVLPEEPEAVLPEADEDVFPEEAQNVFPEAPEGDLPEEDADFLSEADVGSPAPVESAAPLFARDERPEPEPESSLDDVLRFVRQFADTKAAPEEPEVDAIPDEDAADAPLPEPEEPDPAWEESFVPVEPAGHGGSLGKIEQEARSYIAELQSRSGVGNARDRRAAENHTYDLDDLLGMDFGEPPSEADAGLYDAVSASGGTDYEDYDDYDLPADEGLEADPTQRAEDAPVYRPGAYDDEEIDSRFNLSGEVPQGRMSYGGREVDLSADEEYVPVQQSEYNPSQWTPEYDDPLAEREEAAEPVHKRHRFLSGRGRARRAAELDRKARAAAEEDETEEPREESYVSFRDTEAAPADYAEPLDYGMEPEDEEGEGRGSRKYRESEMYLPPTFREYVLSLLASVWLRIRGTVRGRTAETMQDNEEDLGPELTPAEASKYYGSFIRSLKLRVRIAGVVLAVLCYVSLEMPIPGMLRDLTVAAIFCFAAQAAILLLSLDVVTNGVLNLFRLRFGADSLAVVACLLTGIDALTVALSDSAVLHMPLCALSSASVVGLLLASFLHARGLRKATRVPAIGKRFFAVTAEEKLKPGEITLLKSRHPAKGFVRRAEEAALDETVFTKLCPLFLLLAFLLTLIVMIVKKSYGQIIYIFSAMTVLAVPFGALLSYSLPFFLGSTRIFRSGAAIAGWSGLCDIGTSKNLIVTDRDLFPESAVSIESVRIFADEDAQKVISYAGTMIGASGSCAAGCFAELMRETGATMRAVENFEYLPGGGMRGLIDGSVVLCGSTDLMRLMNVRIPFRLTDKTTVLLAIDGILYGIFAMHYEALPQVRRALVDLVRTARPPVFAVRDFNINPEMLHNTFDLATDGYDFPPFVERVKLSEPEEDDKGERIAAILCNEGLGPLTNISDVGRSMYLATRINVLLNILSAVIGIFLVFVRFLATGSNSLGTLFVYMLFWTLPVLLVSIFVSVKK